jgi:CBS domain-containing protein
MIFGKETNVVVDIDNQNNTERQRRYHLAQAGVGVATEFRTHLRDLVPAQPVLIAPECSVREAADTMRQNRCGYALVLTDPPGIITDRDLRDRVIIPGLDLTIPVAQAMTTPLVTVPASSLLIEGMQVMLEQNVRHLPITDNGRIIGVITDSDIVRGQSRSPLLLPRQLLLAHTPADLRAYLQQVARTAGALLLAGARLHDTGRVVAQAQDALLKRLLRDAEADLGPPPCSYAWLVLGSQGRSEQFIATDQDNALIYADDAPPGADAYFAALAEIVVEHLVACGIPRCPGDIVASNARWRQPLRVWQGYFADWQRIPDEEALLRAVIFFDYRQIYGTLDAEAALRPIIRQARENRVFLGRLARTTLQQTPPIGAFGRVLPHRDATGQMVLDLKLRGTALIVDLARLFALEAGCAETNTHARLRQAVGQSVLSALGAEELNAALECINGIRLRHQFALFARNEPPDNLVPLSTLRVFEQRELQVAFQTVRRVQQSLAQAFQTAWIA